MKKRFVWIVAGLSLGLASSVWAANGTMAPDRVGRWDFGMSISGAMNDEIDDGAYYSGEISYGVTPYIGLGVEAGWQEGDTSAANNETVGAVPILADIYLRIPTLHEALVPYGVLGLGIMGVYVTNEPATPSALQGDDVDDSGFAWKLGGGVDWFINNNWIFNFEFAFLSVDVDLPTSSLGNDVSFDFWTVGAGLKYVF